MSRKCLGDAVGRQIAHVRDSRLLHVEALDVVLRELGEYELRVPTDVPFRRLDLVLQQLQEGRLARSVRSDNRDT